MAEEKKALYAVERWTAEYDASQFSSDLASIKRYIQEQAHRDTSSKASAVFVLVEPGKKRIIGYYSLSSISIAFSELPEKTKKRLPRYPEIGGVLLGRLGVDKVFSAEQSKRLGKKARLGELLLVDAQMRCLMHSQQVGSALLVVDAEQPSAEEQKSGARDPLPFYIQYGFVPLTENPRRVIKTMRAIALEFESAQGAVMPEIWVFAYGSNMHLDDLNKWLNARSQFNGFKIFETQVGTLPGYELVWNYFSSSRKAGAANVQTKQGRNLPGLALKVNETCLAGLDAKEGHPSYYERGKDTVSVILEDGRKIDCWLYIARPERTESKLVSPTFEYRQLLLDAAKKYNFPNWYIEELEALAVLT